MEYLLLLRTASAALLLIWAVIYPDFPPNLTGFFSGKHLIQLLANKLQDFWNFVLHYCVLLFDSEQIYLKIQVTWQLIRWLSPSELQRRSTCCCSGPPLLLDCVTLHSHYFACLYLCSSRLCANSTGPFYLNVCGRLCWERGTGTAVSGHLPFQLFRWRLGCSLPALDMLTISRMFCPVQFRVVCCRLCDNLCLTIAEKNEAWKAIWEELGPLLRTALVAGLLEAILECSSL